MFFARLGKTKGTARTSSSPQDLMQLYEPKTIV